MILYYAIQNSKKGTDETNCIELTKYIYDGVSSVIEKEDIIKFFFREKNHNELDQELTFLKNSPEINCMGLYNDRFELLRRLI